FRTPNFSFTNCIRQSSNTKRKRYRALMGGEGQFTEAAGRTEDSGHDHHLKFIHKYIFKHTDGTLSKQHSGMTPAVLHTITSLLPPAGAAVVRYHAQSIGSHARARLCIRPHFHAEGEQSDDRVCPTDTGTPGAHHDERDGDGGRMEKTAELYKAGYADHVLITPVVETEELS